MSHTLASAAAATGLNKPTILRAIKSGKVSATKDDHGKWHIEPAELHRVYPIAAPAMACTDAAQRYALAETHQRAALAEQFALLRSMLDDMRTDRDPWRARVRQLLLTNQRERQPWWRKLAGVK